MYEFLGEFPLTGDLRFRCLYANFQPKSANLFFGIVKEKPSLKGKLSKYINDNKVHSLDFSEVICLN